MLQAVNTFQMRIGLNSVPKSTKEEKQKNSALNMDYREICLVWLAFCVVEAWKGLPCLLEDGDRHKECVCFEFVIVTLCGSVMKLRLRFCLW